MKKTATPIAISNKSKVLDAFMIHPLFVLTTDPDNINSSKYATTLAKEISNEDLLNLFVFCPFPVY
jgi:hypothetical protein